MASDDEVNATIAREVGWTQHFSGDGERVERWTRGDRDLAQPPDYLHGAIACMEALAWWLKADTNRFLSQTEYFPSGTFECLLEGDEFQHWKGVGTTLAEAIARALYAAITGGEHGTD